MSSNKNRTILPLKTTILVFILCSHKTNAQKVYQYNGSGSNCHCEMVFEEKALQPKAVLVIDSEGEDIVKFANQNLFILNQHFQHFNYLYINVVQKGTSEIMDCYERVINAVSVTHKIKLSSFYLLKKANDNEMILQKPNQSLMSFNVLYYKAENISGTLSSISNITKPEDYAIKAETIIDDDEVYDQRMKNYHRNFDLGVNFTPIGLFGSRLGMDRFMIGTYGISLMKNISPQSAIKLSLGGSIKRPDITSIQSNMQSRVMTAVQNGEDTLFIDEALSGHVIIGGDISYRYYFNPTKQLRSFVSLGIGTFNVLSINGRIQDTMDISNIDMSNPASMQGAMGGGINPAEAGGGNIQNLQSRYFVPMTEFGIEYRMAPPLKVNISLPMRYYMNQSKGQSGTFALGMNVGLIFTLNPGKFPKLKEKHK